MKAWGGIILSLGLVSGCGVRLRPMGGQGTAADLAGTWVWSRVIKSDQLAMTITDDDMAGKVGTNGWPGCPAGILCTRYGIKKLAFGPQAQFWAIDNVETSSDYNRIGGYEIGVDNQLHISETYRYSCAHPSEQGVSTAGTTVTWSVEGGELWIANDASSWTVYRKVAETDFYGRYMIRICQDGGKDPRCYKGCFSQDYGR